MWYRHKITRYGPDGEVYCKECHCVFSLGQEQAKHGKGHFMEEQLMRRILHARKNREQPWRKRVA